LTLLQRLTQQPSPVHIPPNEISLTYLHAFLTGEECTELIARSQGLFSRSETGRGISPARTSHSAFPSKHAPAAVVVRRVLLRVMELTGAHSWCIDGPIVVRYEPGQQFTPHFDSSLTMNDKDDSYPPRQFTLFVYLNTLPPHTGGETEFTKLGVKFAPKAGDALFWRNHKDRFTERFDDSEHAGRPPLIGVKYGQSADGEMSKLS
jgi:prolyl 4-hydroxylase